MDLYRYQVREMSDYAMFTLDPEGILRSWNAGVERLLGYSEQEWVGQHARIISRLRERL
jgi:PAS domain S-box-containing protein